jgi:hypothetical protein
VTGWARSAKNRSFCSRLLLTTDLLGRWFVNQELLMAAPPCVADAGRVFPRGAPCAAALSDASEMFVVRDLAY